MYHKERQPALEKNLRRHSHDLPVRQHKENQRNSCFFQDKRQSVNEEIFKQLRIKAGAANMLTALGNCKDKATSKVLEMEVSFVESNIQLLRDQLAKMNTPTRVKSSPDYTPMIAVGLKETRELDMGLSISDFINEHYGESPQNYSHAIEALAYLRKAAQDVYLDESGINALLDYYNQLYYIEHRFFPPDRNMGVFFEWYDSICGDPTAELSISFEKGAILYNVGALWSQIAVSQDFETTKGCEYAADAFQKAAGCFDYLKMNYEGSPSCDMKAETLDVLLTLMLAQAQECTLEMQCLARVSEISSLDKAMMMSTEAAEIAEAYDVCSACLKCGDMWTYIPQSWRSLVLLKTSHYRSLSHFYVAKCLNDTPDSRVADLERHLSQLYIVNSETGTTADICALLVSLRGRRCLASIHLNSASKYRNDAMRTQRACSILRKFDFLYKIMIDCDHTIDEMLQQCQQEFNSIPNFIVPLIRGHSSRKAYCVVPNFAMVETRDMFYNLGPVSVFSALSSWSSARTISLANIGNGFGFEVFGSMPVTVFKITEDSPAEDAGLLPRDFIIGIGGKDIRWQRHCEAVRCIRDAGNDIELKVITPQNTVRLPVTHLQTAPGTRRMTSMFMDTLAISPTSSIVQNNNNNNNNNNSKGKQRSSTMQLLDSANGALLRF